MIEKVSRAALYEKFDNVRTRPGRGGNYQYIRWQDVADRMNEVFGINWSSSVESQEIIGNNVVVKVRVLITDPFTHDKQWQEGFGGAPLDDRQEAGNPHKSAYSKALKDACRKWGIGLFIDEEGEDDTGDQPNNSTGFTPYKRPAYATTAPSAMPSPPTNTPDMSRGAAAQSAMPTRGATPPPPPPSKAQQDTTQKGSEAFASKAPVVNTGDAARISDVQKAALNGILSIKGVEYDSLVNEALVAGGVSKEIVPGIDDLTYQEAVMVIKYGNDKFRKR